jgi:8-oxo-dGTP diphosphatase
MNNRTIDYCAGGLVWRETPGGREVLLILSRKGNEWKFPKGHIDDGDSGWDAAAQREVKEETGYDTAITEFAGFTTYPVNGVPKVVFYWHMDPVGESDFEPSDEILRYDWVTTREAFDRLTFPRDKDFLRQFVKDHER